MTHLESKLMQFSMSAANHYVELCPSPRKRKIIQLTSKQRCEHVIHRTVAGIASKDENMPNFINQRNAVYFIYFIFINLFLYVFIYGCVGSSLLHAGFL